MAPIEVVRKANLTPGDTTPGIQRDQAFEGGGLVVARSRISGGVVSAWHHHGRRELYGFLVSGRIRFDFGPAGGDAVELRPGDFFHIPRGLIHRDVNPDKKRMATVVNVTVGTGPAVINVSGPETP
jgi:mannose-6-phosphate isomerase-like protein (cupin superfamily)